MGQNDASTGSISLGKEKLTWYEWESLAWGALRVRIVMPFPDSTE